MALHNLLAHPNIRLMGGVDEAMVTNLLGQLDSVRREASRTDGKNVVAVELTTAGGDADYTNRIAEEIRLARQYYRVEPIFIGKAFVYSAGITIMGAFAREKRYLTRNTVLLIHERRLKKDVQFSGPIKANLQIAREIVAELENGERIENQNFAQLIEGTDVSMEEIVERAHNGWYCSAEEALSRRLVADLL